MDYTTRARIADRMNRIALKRAYAAKDVKRVLREFIKKHGRVPQSRELNAHMEKSKYTHKRSLAKNVGRSFAVSALLTYY